MWHKTTWPLQKHSTHWKRNQRVKYKQHCFLPVALLCLGTWCYQSFLFAKPHFITGASWDYAILHFSVNITLQIICRPISTLLQAVVSFRHSKYCLWGPGSVGLSALGLNPAENAPFNISWYQHSLWNLRLCLCGNITCSYIESDVQSSIQQSTKTHHDFTSDGTITVSETCCPFLCWKQNK